MQNTLNPDAKVQEDKQDGVFIRKTQDVDYGDIIILQTHGQVQSQNGENPTIIKRALAFGGDYITIAKIDVLNSRLGKEYRFMRVKKSVGQVEVVEEDYIKSYELWTGTSEGTSILVNGVSYERKFYEKYWTYFQCKEIYVAEMGQNVLFFEIPAGQVFFMGDNRSGSTDARTIRPFEVEDIVGKVEIIVRNGSNDDYPANWFYKFKGFVELCWKEILRFFGANI